MKKILVVNYMEAMVHSCVRQSFERIEINGYSILLHHILMNFHFSLASKTCSPSVQSRPQRCRKAWDNLCARVRESDNNAWPRTMWMGYDDSSWDCNRITRFKALVNSEDALRGASILGQVGA